LLHVCVTTLLKLYITKFEFLTALNVKIRLNVFWDLTECSLLYTLHGLVLYLEDAGNTFIRNAGTIKLLSDCMTSSDIYWAVHHCDN